MLDLHDKGPVSFDTLHSADAAGWEWFDAKIAAAADRAMVEVDRETVELFRKYKVPMPSDFARECPSFCRPLLDETTAPANPNRLSDDAAAWQSYLNQKQAERAEINQAMLDTDARRIGATPPHYYRVRRPKDPKYESISNKS